MAEMDCAARSSTRFHAGHIGRAHVFISPPGPKSEVRNPKSELNPKSEARELLSQPAIREYFFHSTSRVHLGLRISAFLRASGILISDFRPGL